MNPCVNSRSRFGHNFMAAAVTGASEFCRKAAWPDCPRNNAGRLATFMKTLPLSLWLFLMTPVLASAAGFEINRFTIGGGGGTSSGGPFSVSGTIGQPAAGSLGGGAFSLDGGFWSVPVVVQVPDAPTLRITTLIATPGFAILSWDSSVMG